MAKRSRRSVSGDSVAHRPAASSAGRPATGSPESRLARGARARRTQQPSPLARYRTLVVSGAAAVGLLIVAWLFFQGSTQAAYSCDSLLTPGPVESVTPRPATPTPGPSTPSPSPSPTASGSPAASASPAASGSPAVSGSPAPSASPTAVPTPQPEPTARLGFTTNILGRNHISDTSASLRYGFCPPTSGDHFNTTNRGPIRAGVYPKTEEQIPGGWIHNLEHGYTVALYRCSAADDCPSDAEMAQLQALFDQAPTSINPACPRKLIVARLDQMDTRFAVLAWGRALLLDEFDLDTALTFAQQWTDHEAVPERGTC